VSPFPPRPEFFLDRSLGRHQVASALRAAGWRLRTHHEVYGARDEEVPDAEWLEMCGAAGLVVLSKDRKIRYRPAEMQMIRRFSLRAFILTSGSLTASAQAERLIANAERIDLACAGAGPFVYAVQETRVVRIFPL